MFEFDNIEVVKPSQLPRSLKSLGIKKLYAVGNLELLSSKCASVAGSRQIKPSGIRWLNAMIPQCSGYSIVSGLALGADKFAHHAALRSGIPTIAILPSGINNITPKRHIKLAQRIVRDGGLLLSEYEPSSGPNRDRYIRRNRLIASLGDFLLMPQCDEHSGTMHTVRYAGNQGKYIVLPDSDYSGNQYIINNPDEFKTLIK